MRGISNCWTVLPMPRPTALLGIGSSMPPGLFLLLRQHLESLSTIHSCRLLFHQQRPPALLHSQGRQRGASLEDNLNNHSQPGEASLGQHRNQRGVHNQQGGSSGQHRNSLRIRTASGRIQITCPRHHLLLFLLLLLLLQPRLSPYSDSQRLHPTIPEANHRTTPSTPQQAQQWSSRKTQIPNPLHPVPSSTKTPSSKTTA